MNIPVCIFRHYGLRRIKVSRVRCLAATITGRGWLSSLTLSTTMARYEHYVLKTPMYSPIDKTNSCIECDDAMCQ